MINQMFIECTQNGFSFVKGLYNILYSLILYDYDITQKS